MSKLKSNEKGNTIIPDNVTDTILRTQVVQV